MAPASQEARGGRGRSRPGRSPSAREVVKRHYPNNLPPDSLQLSRLLSRGERESRRLGGGGERSLGRGVTCRWSLLLCMPDGAELDSLWPGANTKSTALVAEKKSIIPLPCAWAQVSNGRCDWLIYSPFFMSPKNAWSNHIIIIISCSLICDSFFAMKRVIDSVWWFQPVWGSRRRTFP